MIWENVIQIKKKDYDIEKSVTTYKKGFRVNVKKQKEYWGCILE